MDLEQKTVVDFLAKEGCTPMEIHGRLKTVYGDAVVDISKVRRWTSSNMATPRRITHQVRNEMEFLVLGEELIGPTTQQQQHSDNNLVSTFTHGILSRQSRDNLRNSQTAFERDYEPTIRGIVSDFEKHGRKNLFMFIREIYSCVMADGFSWSRILFLIFTIGAVIGDYVYDTLEQIMSFLWSKVGDWIISQGGRFISAIAWI